MTTRSESSKGSGEMRTPSTRVNTAVLAPIPRARVATAVTVKVGYRSRLRTAKRTSLKRPVIVIVSFLSQRASITQLRTRIRSFQASGCGLNIRR